MPSDDDIEWDEWDEWTSCEMYGHFFDPDEARPRRCTYCYEMEEVD